MEEALFDAEMKRSNCEDTEQLRKENGKERERTWQIYMWLASGRGPMRK